MAEFYKNIKVEKDEFERVVITVRVNENFNQQLIFSPDQMEKVIASYRKIKQG